MSDDLPTPFRITIKPKGTIVIEGTVILRDPEGNEIPQPPPKHPGILKLCGCGRSATRPFCDGSHKLGPGERGTGNRGSEPSGDYPVPDS